MNIFEHDESNTLHVKFDWWKPSLGNYKGNFLEQYWVPIPNDVEHGSIPINDIVWAWIPRKKYCKKIKINEYGVEVVLILLEQMSSQ